MTAVGTPYTITAERVYLDGGFQPNIVLAVGVTGMIAAIESGRDADVRLDGQALIPGFVNAHSHAFQRALRGCTATRPSDRQDHFWTWREEMYRLVSNLTPDELFAHSLQAFHEMAAAGFTAVGEFHYVHRDPTGEPYDDPNLLARRVIEAALETGLRIRLLNVFYERGGLRDEPLSGGQLRFGGEPVDDFLDRTRALSRSYVAEDQVAIGVAAHSLRATTPEALERIIATGIAEDWPFHIHLSEQESEVRECLEIHGRRPVELLADLGGLGPGTTGIHCTHVSDTEIHLLGDSGAGVCACPTTEADLGDGFLRAAELRGSGVPISLGTDSQARIDPFEEMRAVEYHERLKRQERNVLAASEGGSTPSPPKLAGELLAMATRSGARSLGLPTGVLAPGHWADFVSVDLGHALLHGWNDDNLDSLLALGADPRIVSGTYVAGRKIA